MPSNDSMATSSKSDDSLSPFTHQSAQLTQLPDSRSCVYYICTKSVTDAVISFTCFICGGKCASTREKYDRYERCCQDSC